MKTIHRRPGAKLTVITGSEDTYEGQPVHSAIVRNAHLAGLTGATVLDGIEGFGANSRVHSSRLLSISDNLPVSVVVVDAPDRIERFLPELDGIVSGGVITVEAVDIIEFGES
ncbi:DUF190 domain-containing protein [Stackebrandtia soli]|uniref:DUF190 domain-containing protein n=1 Tax=Stackebrandtia soli TaxID=1892856 RepID=UPI0039EB9B13